MLKYNLNLRSTIDYSLRNFGDQDIVYRGERLKLKEFFEGVSRLADSLIKLGVKKGETVAVLDWDSLLYLEAYYAVPMIGAVLHTVNIRYPLETIFYTMINAEDKFAIVGEDFTNIAEKGSKILNNIRYWILKDGKNSQIENSISYDSLLKTAEIFSFPEIDENERATIFYTSGTTGFPKGVTFTHRKLVLHAISLALSLRKSPINLSQDDVFLGLVPFFHAHAWVFPYTAIMLGNKLVLPGRYDMKIVLELIKKEGVTIMYMVPSVLYMLISYPDIKSYLDSIKGLKVIVGGSSLPIGLARKARDLGIRTIGTYGLSEAGPVVTVSYHNSYANRIDDERRWEIENAPGIPLPFMNLRVVDTNGKDLPWDGRSVGEIVIRAPWLTDGYYKDPEKTEELWRDGWLHTGDLAVVDPLGYIHIVEREKDAVKSGGEFIQSILLESIISEIPEVGEVAIIGRKDEKWGERPIAFVTLKSRIDKEKIYSHLNRYVETGRIQKWWIPDDIIFIESMPKTSTNKIDKKILREKLRDYIVESN